jgi:hypothetical protein
VSASVADVADVGVDVDVAATAGIVGASGVAGAGGGVVGTVVDVARLTVGVTVSLVVAAGVASTDATGVGSPTSCFGTAGVVGAVAGADVVDVAEDARVPTAGATDVSGSGAGAAAA